MQNLNIKAEMEGGRGGERKRGRVAANYRLNRTFLMGKRRGSSTPVPPWKMIGSRSQSIENDWNKAFSYLNGGNAKELSVSARKLAAVLWEIDGMPYKERRILESSKLRSMELAFSDPFLTTFSQGKLDPPTKLCSFRRRSLATNNLTISTSIPSCLGQVDETQVSGQKNNLKDVYNGLTACKQLFQVLIGVWGVEHLDCTSKSLVSALRRQLHQSCDRVRRLIRGQKTEKSDTSEVLLKQIKHSIHNAVVGELDKEKKLRVKSEKMNKRTGAELAETKAYLSMAIIGVERERDARRKAEKVCEELAEGIWDMKRQFGKVREEVEKEREMFHVADLLREERVQMKLYEARCLYEEQNALVVKLRNELQAYTLQNHGKESDNNAVVNEDKGEEESDESDAESNEFSRSFVWGNAVKNGWKRSSVVTTKEETRKTSIPSKLQQNVKQENQEFFATIRLCEFT